MFGRKKNQKDTSPKPQETSDARVENTKLFMAEIKAKSLSDLKTKAQTKDDYKRTPLHCALEFETEPKVIEFLLKNGANPNEQDDNGNTPLHYAAQNGDIESVKLLLAYNAKPNVTNIYAKTALDDINSKKTKHSLALYEELLQAGAIGCFWEPLDYMSPKMQKALICLATKHYKATEYDSQKNTLLHWAAYFGLVEETKILLEKNLSVKARNLHKQTPLSLANQEENHVISSMLLAANNKK